MKVSTRFKLNLISEYAEVMEYAITDWGKQNNLSYPNCAANIRESFHELKQMVYTESGRSLLNRYFK